MDLHPTIQPETCIVAEVVTGAADRINGAWPRYERHLR